jgi:hypothetical protein
MSIFLIGALGLALDGSMLYGHRQMAQSAADAAAQGAMLSIFHGTNATATYPFATGTTPAPYTCTTTDGTTPCAYARINGFGGLASDSVSITYPTSVPGVNLGAGNASAMTVRVQRSVNATLMAYFGVRTYTIAATATAAMVRFPMANCVIALDPSASDAFSISGNADMNLTSCGIAVDSTSNSAFRANGNISLNATGIDVVGGVDQNGNVTINPTPTTGVTPVGDPFASVPAPPPGSCVTPNPPITSNTTLRPGTYCGGISISGNASVTFQTGPYILLGGGLNASGTVSLTGSGVTFYNTFDTTHPFDSISITGNLTMNLSAPASGALAGMLFFEDRNAPTGYTEKFAGNSSSNLTGAMYFPNNEVEYTGNSSAGVQNVAIVADTVSFIGNASLKSDPSVPGAAQQIKVALVQ